MSKNKVYGTYLELEAFSIIINVKIICYIRNIKDENYRKLSNDEINTYILNEEKDEELEILLNHYGEKNQKIIHFQSFKSKIDKNISNNRLEIIKNNFYELYNSYKTKVNPQNNNNKKDINLNKTQETNDKIYKNEVKTINIPDETKINFKQIDLKI